ncbi:unnamed protein product, partial [Symbiodinium sp. CCMP2456]
CSHQFKDNCLLRRDHGAKDCGLHLRRRRRESARGISSRRHPVFEVICLLTRRHIAHDLDAHLRR